VANAPAQTATLPAKTRRGFCRWMAVGVTVVERWGEWLAFSPEEFF
jgi:hypothetical protein